MGKTYPSPAEKKRLQSISSGGVTFMPSPTIWMFESPALGNFAVAVCYEFMDLDRIVLYRNKIQTLFILAYNRDTTSFGHLAEAIARMVFCNVVVCNCGVYGESLAVSPFREPSRRTVYPGFPFCPPNQGLYPGFPICLPRMAPLYTREPPSAQNSVRRAIVQLQRRSPQPALTCDRLEPKLSGISQTPLHTCALSSPDFLGQRSPAILPAPVAPRSSAACRRTAAG